jgi:glucose-6-phosphate 1-epimerase
VVWNPGEAKARAMADLGDPAWTGFVCVETVCAGSDAITLAPGAAHTLGASISVEQG